MFGRLAPGIRQALEETGATRLYEDVERPLVRVLAKMEVAGIAVDVDRLRAINDELTAEAGASRPRSSRSPARSSTSTRRRSSGASCSTSSSSRPSKAHEDRLLDRRPEPRAPARRASGGRHAAALPRSREAPLHLRRGPARRGRTRRADPRLVQPDRRPHGSALVGSAEPAQHPGAQPHRAALPRGIRPERRASSLLIADYDQIELRVIAHLVRRSRARRGLPSRGSTSTTPPRQGSTASSRPR